MDALSDVLRALRICGGIYLDAAFSAPWCVASRVGPADHLVPLVVVAEDEDAIAERRLGGLDACGELGLRSAGVALVEGGLEPQHVVGVLHVGFRLLDGGDSPVASPAGMSSPELDMSPDAGPARSA